MPVRRDNPGLLVRDDLCILPAEVHTYYLPARSNDTLRINLTADAAVNIRVLELTSWLALATTSERQEARPTHAAGNVRALSVELVATTNYMLLVWSDSPDLVNLTLEAWSAPPTAQSVPPRAPRGSTTRIAVRATP